MSGEVPSQAAFEQAFDEMGLANAPEAVLDNDDVTLAQYERAAEIDAEARQ